MGLYEFVMQNKDRFMDALRERNQKAPQQSYSRFSFTDNRDFKKATIGFFVQGNVQKEMPDNEPEPDSLLGKIQSTYRKTMKLGKKALENALGHDNTKYEAWAALFCRDLKELEGVEKEIKIEGWKEVKDPETRERYKGLGQMFYEYDRWVLALQYNQKGMNLATMIYRHPERFDVEEYYNQLDPMLNWMISALEKSQEIKAPVKAPEPVRAPEKATQPIKTVEKPAEPQKIAEAPKEKMYELDNEVYVDDKHQGTFAIREAEGHGIEAGLVMGNIPEINDDIKNQYATEMKNKGYSTIFRSSRLALVKKLQKKPSDMETIEIKMDMIDNLAEFIRIIES